MWHAHEDRQRTSLGLVAGGGIRPNSAPEGLQGGPIARIAWAVTRKAGPPCELRVFLKPQTGGFLGISEDHGFRFTLAPCGGRKQPLKTALQQGADLPLCARRALKQQISPTSCRPVATYRNLNRKLVASEIRRSRITAQRFFRGSRGFRVHPTLSRLYGANFGLSGDPPISLPPGDPVRSEYRCRCRSAFDTRE